MTSTATNQDAALALLLQASRHKPGPALWLADEQHRAIIGPLAATRADITVVSNRFDVHELCRQQRLDSRFNDWVLPTDHSWQSVFLRVGKEKPVVHHLINQAFALLPAEGELIITGEKSDGIKTYLRKAGELFGSPADNSKQGSAYLGRLTKSTAPGGALLATQEYTKIRPVGHWHSAPLHSKPGVYGWNKIDRGSALLVEAVLDAYAQRPPLEGLLDLGCGYGLLTIATGELPAKRRVATDNNAGAIACMAHNADQWQLSVEVVAADCADRVRGVFDLILCNPPFHAGFSVDSALGERFLRAASAHLAPGGSAWFVVNSFLPLERAASPIFRQVEVIKNNRQFKVIRVANG